MDKQTAKKIEVVPCPDHKGRFQVSVDGIFHRMIRSHSTCGTEAEARAKAAELRKAIGDASYFKSLAAQPTETRQPLESNQDWNICVHCGEDLDGHLMVQGSCPAAHLCCPGFQSRKDTRAKAAELMQDNQITTGAKSDENLAAAAPQVTTSAETRPPRRRVQFKDVLLRDLRDIQESKWYIKAAMEDSDSSFIRAVKDVAEAFATAPVEPPPCQDCEEIRKKFLCPKHDPEDTEYEPATEPVEQAPRSHRFLLTAQLPEQRISIALPTPEDCEEWAIEQKLTKYPYTIKELTFAEQAEWESENGAAASSPVPRPQTASWTEETMTIINKLTPDIKGKAFDPGWFLLRQRFEEMERQRAASSPAARPRYWVTTEWYEPLQKANDAIFTLEEKASPNSDDMLRRQFFQARVALGQAENILRARYKREGIE